MFMRPNVSGCAFTDFIRRPPNDLGDDVREIVEVLQARGARDFETLEALVTFLQHLEFESINIAVAPDVWRSYKKWRIRQIGDVACLAVDEGQDVR
jgi:hypothetical protein